MYENDKNLDKETNHKNKQEQSHVYFVLLNDYLIQVCPYSSTSTLDK